MRVLLDECVPRPLRQALMGFDVSTIRDEGWTGKTNGELIGLMVGRQFDVLLTVDQNLPYQQNLSAAGIALVIMAAKSNRLPDLLPLVSQVIAELSTVTAGEVRIV